MIEKRKGKLGREEGKLKGQIFRHRYRSSKEALNDVNFQIRHGGNGRRGGEDVSRDRFDSIDPFNPIGDFSTERVAAPKMCTPEKSSAAAFMSPYSSCFDDVY